MGTLDFDNPPGPIAIVTGSSGVAFVCMGKYYNNAGEEVGADGESLPEPKPRWLCLYPGCKFEAKTKAGLRAHRRKHKNESDSQV